MKTKAKILADEKGFSGLQLSYTTRISPADISRYLRGERKPFPGHAERIASALGWTGDPMQLFEEEADHEQ